MQKTVMSGDTGLPRRDRRRLGWVVALSVAMVAAACGSGDDEKAAEESEQKTAELATELGGGRVISEDELPAGFEPAPTVTLDGQEFKMDTIPGHYWKALDNGYAIGFHFQSEQPFRWAQDAGDNDLLYVVYAIPGSCKALNFQAGLKSAESTPGGAPPPRFDHWHGLVGDKGAGERGHWLMHLPVRDFTFGGMSGNPFDGKKISIANDDPWFMPVCEPAMVENPAMMQMEGNK